MSLNQNIIAFLARAEPKPAPSKLEPYADLIRTLRQRRWPYVEIAKALSDEFGVQAHLTTVHAFVKVRAKKKSASTMPAPEQAAIDRPTPPTSDTSGARRPRFHQDAFCNKTRDE
jgi:hypothetical protein